MSKYFQSSEFSELREKPAATKEPTPDKIEKVSREEWRRVSEEIHRIMRAVESGESELTPHAVQLKNAPVVNLAAALFMQEPSLARIRKFLQVAQEDVNRRFRKECLLVFCSVEAIKKALIRSVGEKK